MVASSSCLMFNDWVGLGWSKMVVAATGGSSASDGDNEEGSATFTTAHSQRGSHGERSREHRATVAQKYLGLVCKRDSQIQSLLRGGNDNRTYKYF